MQHEPNYKIVCRTYEQNSHQCFNILQRTRLCITLDDTVTYLTAYKTMV